jgi:uncharacterized membrane protein
MEFYFKKTSSKLSSSGETSKKTDLTQNEKDRAKYDESCASLTQIEIANHSVWRHKKSFRTALISIFSALAVVLGYILAYLPNVELFTLIIFLSGFVLSKKEGLLIGFLSSLIFTFFNPLGTSPPPLFLYQITHYSFTGFLGGLVNDYFKTKKYYKPNDDLYIFKIMLIFGIIGGLITFFYDILSTLIGGFLVSFKIEYFITTYLTGIVFTSVHLVGNILGFVLLLPGLIQIIIKLLD